MTERHGDYADADREDRDARGADDRNPGTRGGDRRSSGYARSERSHGGRGGSSHDRTRGGERQFGRDRGDNRRSGDGGVDRRGGYRDGGRGDKGFRTNGHDDRGHERRGGEHRGDRRWDRRDEQRDNSRGDRRGAKRYGDDRREGARRTDDRRGSNRGGRDDSRRSNRDGFTHANRGGAGRTPHSGPQRSGYREERLNKRLNEPTVPADLDPRDLDPSVRQELRSLSKDNADMVAKHLIMAATLLEEDPAKALEHARAAKDRAGRVSVARETNGIVAYHAGEWKEAISELRAARRMSGGPGLLAVLADAERGLGRPEKALEVGTEPGADELDPESRTELAIVLAGAHHDLGQVDEAVVVLQECLNDSEVPDVTKMRLYYAYADALETIGRNEEAAEWFERAGELDSAGFMDIPERLAQLSEASAGEEPTAQ